MPAASAAGTSSSPCSSANSAKLKACANPTRASKPAKQTRSPRPQQGTPPLHPRLRQSTSPLGDLPGSVPRPSGPSPRQTSHPCQDPATGLRQALQFGQHRHRPLREGLRLGQVQHHYSPCSVATRPQLQVLSKPPLDAVTHESVFSAPVWIYDGDSPWYFVTLPRAVAAKIRETASRQGKAFGSVKVAATLGERDGRLRCFQTNRRRPIRCR